MLESSGSSAKTSIILNEWTQQQQKSQTIPGTLPDGANHLSKGARALLMRLLERDPKVRLRNLRQLQQTAFYMRYNFEHINIKKVAPKDIFENHFINQDQINVPINEDQFLKFDQSAVFL